MVVLEHRGPTQLARDHGISKRWIFKLLRRFKEGGYPALEPRSRRPKSSPRQVGAKVQELILELRRDLTAAGHDAGPQTIAYHLQGQLEELPSVATIWRILKRQGLVTPQPHKRPRASSSSVSKPSCPTRPGRSTPPPGSSLMGTRSRS